MIWKPHTTVAAVVERDGKFLIVEEDVEGSIVFNQPAGHLEPDESIVEAVIRETQEETARHFQPQALVGVYLWKQPETGNSFLRFAFCGTCSNHDPDQPLDDGIIQTHWMHKDELLAQNDKLRSPLVIKCIEDYISGRRHPLDTVTTVTDTI